jgi:copper(I)-binding protein
MTKQGITSRAIAPFAGLVVMVSAWLFAAAAGCSSPTPQITIEGAYGELSPVFIGAGSVYLKIRNAGGRDTLVGASVDIPRTVVELHDIRDNRMVRVGKMDVPSRETAELKPGSFHIMIFNMPKTIQKGSELALTLRFERSGERTEQIRFEK